MLKVVHIATYINGGAGTAAYRIHEALLAKNVDSYFLCTDEPVNTLAKPVIRFQKPAYSLPERAWRKLKRMAGRKVDLGKINYRHRLKHTLEKMRPSLHCEVAGLPFSDFDLLSHPAVKSADILHLHWVGDLLDYPSFFKNNNKPVVWTFHDMNPLLGLYHYEADEKRNASISGNLDSAVKQIKRKAVKESKAPLTVVAPSQWLQRYINNCDAFGASPVMHIPYALNTDVFCIKDTVALRQELEIPAENTILLFVSQSVANFRKGFDLLSDALQQLNNPPITLLIIGYAEHLYLPAVQCINLGSIYNNEALSNYYSLADAFIIPSREDNLPNVMLESLACGTPVISFNVGGMSEIIKDNFNGLKAGEVASISLNETLEKFIGHKSEFCAKQIRRFALENFLQDKIAGAYVELYENLLK